MAPASLAGSSDEQLMDAYLDGDHDAFDVLFRRHRPALVGLVATRLRSRNLAEEIVQQTFFNLHRARDTYRRGARFRPWVTTIAMNLVREHFRRTAQRRMVSLDWERQLIPQESLTAFERSEWVSTLDTMLAKLPKTQREVIDLHWFHDLHYDEVARRIGTSEGAARVRAHRACATLRRELAAELSLQ